MGRKLRTMTVEKGLLRETKVVQEQLDALVECRVSSDSHPWAVPWSSYSYTQSYMDGLEDLLATAALRMLVKDFHILFQAVNEGIINVLGKDCDRAPWERLSILELFRSLLRDVLCRCRTGPSHLSTFLHRQNSRLNFSAWQKDSKIDSMYPSRV
jgi:hypothetical protein